MLDTTAQGELDTLFGRNGRTWRVTAATGTFIIATAIDAERDKKGDLVNAYDVLKVRR